MTKLFAYAKQLRVTHWTKNVMLFIPFVFTLPMVDPMLLGALSLGFIAFSLAASGVYVVNDLCDIEKDRLHPKKKFRPLASGAISKFEGYLLLLGCWVGALWISRYLPSAFGLILVGYVIMNLAYSFHLKHVVIMDILLVALMYLGRIYAGTAIIGVEPSSWIQLTTFAGSLFLITSKRYSEVQNQVAGATRKILQYYPEKLLELLLSVSVTLTLMCYGLYALNKSPLFVLTVPIVAFGIFRYCFLIFYKKLGENPEKTMFDTQILVTISLWILSCGLILTLAQETFMGEFWDSILGLWNFFVPNLK